MLSKPQKCSPLLLFLSGITSTSSASLVKRQSCSAGYTTCAPAGATSTLIPGVGPGLAPLYVDLVNSVQGIKAGKRDLEGRGQKNEAEIAGLEERASGENVCCKSTLYLRNSKKQSRKNADSMRNRRRRYILPPPPRLLHPLLLRPLHNKLLPARLLLRHHRLWLLHALRRGHLQLNFRRLHTRLRHHRKHLRRRSRCKPEHRDAESANAVYERGRWHADSSQWVRRRGNVHDYNSRDDGRSDHYFRGNHDRSLAVRCRRDGYAPCANDDSPRANCHSRDGYERWRGAGLYDNYSWDCGHAGTESRGRIHGLGSVDYEHNCGAGNHDSGDYGAGDYGGCYFQTWRWNGDAE